MGVLLRIATISISIFETSRIYRLLKKLIYWFIFYFVLGNYVDQWNPIIWIHKRNVCQRELMNFMIVTSESFENGACEAIYYNRFSDFQPDNPLQTPRFILWLWIFHINLINLLLTETFAIGTFTMFSKHRNWNAFGVIRKSSRHSILFST